MKELKKINEHVTNTKESWDILLESIREKLIGKTIFCDGCKKQIKRNKFSISFKLPKKYQNLKNIPLDLLKNLRYVKCNHFSCANKMLEKAFKK